MINRLVPFIGWLKAYDRFSFRADLVSGLTVAMVLIPQSMAYAQLAGLPAYYGLYAAFLPPMVAGLFGSSRQLATGPVTLVSLMTATALAPLATAGSASYIAYAVFLALLIGLFQFALGVLRLGVVVNFLSYPVVNGFISAAAVISIASQLPTLFGIDMEKTDHFLETVLIFLRAIPERTHWPTLGMAVLAVAIMLGLRRLNARIPHVLAAVAVTTILSWAVAFECNHHASFSSIADPEVMASIRALNRTLDDIEEAGAERVRLVRLVHEAEREHGSHSIAVLEREHLASLKALEIEELREKARIARDALRSMVFESRSAEGTEDPIFSLVGPESTPASKGDRWRLEVGNNHLNESSLTFIGGGTVIGNIPRGLPEVALPDVKSAHFLELFPVAVIIALLGFMQAISCAKTMAAKTGQHLDANQELIGQGVANILGSLTQSYAVSGSLSRSALNLAAGARTGISSVFSSGVVVITLLLFTPLLYHLPQSVLAAVIIVAVAGLINIRGFIRTWQAQVYDGAIGLITFGATLLLAPYLEYGLVIGVVLSSGLFLFHHIRPDIVLLSRYTDGTYRDADRYGLEHCRHIAVIRFNGSLFFADVNSLENKILDQVADMPELRHILLVGNGINRLDASGEQMLSMVVDRMRDAGHDFSISGLNDAVRDVMRRTGLYQKIGEGHLFRNVAMALDAIHEKTHQDTDEADCPLIRISFKGFPVSADIKRRPFILEGPRETGDQE